MAAEMPNKASVTTNPLHSTHTGSLLPSPARRGRPPLCSLKGVCSGDTHPLLNLLLFPVVLTARSIGIYLLPMFGAYLNRLLRACLTRACARFSCFMFRDAAFPLQASSIGAMEGLPEVEWVRIPELDPSKPFRLFEGAIEPADLIQGQVGDCYLISALASLAETPAAIRSVVLNAERSARGQYSVRVFDGVARKWEVVTVDDFVPVKKGTREPLMIRPHGNEIWACVIEKALAKYCGSYHALEAGHTEWAWHALTGDPAFHLEKSADGASWARSDLLCAAAGNRRGAGFRATGEAVRAGDLFGVMQAYVGRRCVVGASIYKTAVVKREQALDDGLVAGHAYSVLQARRVGRSVADMVKDTHGSGHTLVQLRNPWGGKAGWRGAWSRDSPLWATFPDVARELAFSAAAEDGAFWMDIVDFRARFSKVSICDRSTKNDLRLDTHEGMPLCGPLVGCVGGCAAFWCLCRGLRVIYCGAHATGELREADETCACVPADVKDGLRGAAKEARHAALAVRGAAAEAVKRAAAQGGGAAAV